MMTFNVAHASAIVGALVLGVLLPTMSEDLGLSPLQQGWLGSSAIIGSLILSIPFGLWMSRYRPMILTAITLFLGAGFVFMQAAASNFAILLLGRLLFGITPVAREASRVLLVRQWLPAREIQLSSGILNAVFGISLTISFVVAPLMLEAFDNNWRTTLYAWGYFSIGMAVAWVLLGRENRTVEYEQDSGSQEGSPMKSLFKYKEPWLLGVAILGYAIAQMSQFTFWPTFMKDEYGMSEVRAGMVIGVVGVVVAAGGLVMLPVIKRFGGYRIPLIGIGILIAATNLVVLFTGSMPILVGAFIINGLARGGFWIPFTSLPFELPGILPREAAVVQGMMFSMLWLGSVVGPLLVAVIQTATGSLQLAMIISALCPIAVTVTGLFISARTGGGRVGTARTDEWERARQLRIHQSPAKGHRWLMQAAATSSRPRAGTRPASASPTQRRGGGRPR